MIYKKIERHNLSLYISEILKSRSFIKLFFYQLLYTVFYQAFEKFNLIVYDFYILFNLYYTFNNFILRTLDDTKKH